MTCLRRAGSETVQLLFCDDLNFDEGDDKRIRELKLFLMVIAVEAVLMCSNYTHIFIDEHLMLKSISQKMKSDAMTAYTEEETPLRNRLGMDSTFLSHTFTKSNIFESRGLMALTISMAMAARRSQ